MHVFVFLLCFIRSCGYAQTLNPRGVPNGWDVPVAIGFAFDVRNSEIHKILKNDVQTHTLPLDRRCIVPLHELPIVSLQLWEPQYENMQELIEHWPQLLEGESVLCRTRYYNPGDFFKLGHGDGWSCCRVTPYPKACGWIKTKNQWWCKECDFNNRNQLGSVTGER